MEQIRITCQLCGDICHVFRRPLSSKASSFLMCRLAAFYFSYLNSTIPCLQKTKSSATGQKGKAQSDARLIQVFQSALYLLKSLKHASIGKSKDLFAMEPLLRAVVELGLGLCEHVGALGNHARRSKVVWMLHWVGRYLKNVMLLDPLTVGERKRLDLMMARLPDA